MNKRLQNENPYIATAKAPEVTVIDGEMVESPLPGSNLGKIPAHLIKPTRTLACKRIAVKKIFSLLPTKYIEALEQNQQIASCCRHPEDHDIEAWFSHPRETAPDIYIFHCRCGRQHRRFCVGGGDVRPFWEMS